MLPEGIGVIPLFLNIRHGTTDEFKRSVDPYLPLLEELASDGVEVIHAEGAPPFMLLGYEGEAQLLREWEERYETPVFTSGTNHVAAFKALKVTKIVGATYFTGEINNIFADYFKEAGFDVLAMEGIDVPFEAVGRLPPKEVYAHVKRTVLRHQEAEAIYLLGSGWRVLPVIESLEEDLGLPVVHPVPARCWEIQKRLGVHQSVKGYGTLLAEML